MGKHMPHIGARIVKSSLGAGICVLIYFIRELLPIGSGIPLYSIDLPSLRFRGKAAVSGLLRTHFRI